MAGGYMAQTRPSPTLSWGFTRLGRFRAPYAVRRYTGIVGAQSPLRAVADRRIGNTLLATGC